MNEPTLFSDFLEALEVPHTVCYSNTAFKEMPFQSCFGLIKLLKQYNIESEGIQIDDKNEIDKLDCPFLAKTPKGFVIVTAVSPTAVSYLSDGVAEIVGRQLFLDAWTGVTILAYPTADSAEPNYGQHHFQVEVGKAKKTVLLLGAIFLFFYFFISRGLWAHVSTWFLTLFDLAGLFFTYLLVQKSANVKSRMGDRVCGILEKGGCDSVLATKASSFFGIFGWSEVGFAYFSVSLLTMLIFPQWIKYLALCNACCLPFTFWSIWYQKFRAKAWCTLCVCTQGTLWCLFFSYLAGGWFSGIFPLKIQLIVLGACYLTALLAINRVMPLIEKIKVSEIDENDFKAQN